MEKQESAHKQLTDAIRYVEIRSRRMASELFSGEYHSSFKGKGIEFSHVREYQYGDDVRAIDWNTSARKHDLYVKQFTEERERTMLLLVDGSASMLFGSRKRSKRDLALEVSAVLAYSAIQNNDKVGLLVFTDRIETFIPPAKGRRQVLVILDALFNLQPENRNTDITAALSFVRFTQKRKAIIFLLTDLDDRNYEGGMKLLNTRHDFVLVHLSDPLDKALPRTGLLLLEDPETRRSMIVDAGSRKKVERYREAQSRYYDDLRQRLRRMKIDTVFLDTDRSFISDLNAFFRYREQKI
ncbi:protein of unknown function DUF58 [Chlorobium phaeobacteroides DSM 266]|jgi:uncharacterized protein (DUF58 family)|uniref:DUF58 domain-containing protein n=2 Tax=Chlorobium phaeobacteroides TaxID=1096 RepID=A1BJ65_CHLPD|nr:protein of unknown function DUF58 [Chlorobium phaeobacteroides DSM 266]MBV5319530.1 DUF58 domain-containing protein [Chlorobium phaeobacteroides]